MITSTSDFITYVKTMLGAPVINIEISDSQITQAIEDSYDLLTRYAIGDGGAYEDYMYMSLSAHVSAYSLSGLDIASIESITYSNSIGGDIGNLFSPMNMLFGGNVNIFNTNSFSLTNYETYCQYIGEVNRMFTIEFRLNFNSYTSILQVIPTPTTAVGSVIKVYKKQTMSNVYNHPLLKGMVLAKCKIIWSRSLMKYGNITLPGGGDLAAFGTSLLSEGIESEKDFLQRMKDESGESATGFFFVG